LSYRRINERRVRTRGDAGRRLLGNAHHSARTNGATAFADSEGQAFFHRDGLSQFHIHNHVIAGHRHLYFILII